MTKLSKGINIVSSAADVIKHVEIGGTIRFRERNGKTVKFANRGFGYWVPVPGEDTDTIGRDVLLTSMMETEHVTYETVDGELFHFYIERR